LVLKINENMNEIPKILDNYENLNLKGFDVLIHEKKESNLN